MTSITVVNAHRRYRISRERVVQMADLVTSSEGVRVGDINIVFVTDEYIRKINSKYLHHRRSTDVISFRLDEGNSVDGEVYVSLDAVRRQSRQYRVTFTNEVRRLVIHGILHLLGYHDRRKEDRAVMRHREDTYLALL